MERQEVIKPIEYKSIIGADVVKDVDTESGVVTVYYSAKNMVDSDEDSIVDGAYKKSISEWGPKAKNRIWHLINHSTEKHVAKPFELIEDHYGLLARVKMPNTTLGRDTLELYKEGHYTEHSFGFNTVKSEKKSGYNEIQEVRVFEGSSVLWGANEKTPTVGVKSLTKEQAYDEFERTIKSLRNGKYTDETFELLELKLLQLQSYFIDVTKTTEPVITTQPDAMKESEILAIIEITKQNLRQ
jgi:uncharacterized protein